MYHGYDELNTLPPSAFLNWEDFRTEFDALAENSEYAKAQYQTGLNIGRKSDQVFISVNGTWGAVRDGGKNTTSSCEGIGYHSCTADLLHGFLDSGVQIIVYRYENLGGTVIKWDSKRMRWE